MIEVIKKYLKKLLSFLTFTLVQEFTLILIYIYIRSPWGSEYRISNIVVLFVVIMLLIKLMSKYTFQFIVGPLCTYLIKQLWFIRLYDKIITNFKIYSYILNYSFIAYFSLLYFYMLKEGMPFSAMLFNVLIVIYIFKIYALLLLFMEQAGLSLIYVALVRGKKEEESLIISKNNLERALVQEQIKEMVEFMYAAHTHFVKESPSSRHQLISLVLITRLRKEDPKNYKIEYKSVVPSLAAILSRAIYDQDLIFKLTLVIYSVILQIAVEKLFI